MKKKVTIYDIAETAGVSPASVSRMIHQPEIVTEKTKNKILKAFQEHGIRPEDLSVRKKETAQTTVRSTAPTDVILVCLPSWDNPFYDNILQGISDYLTTVHYHMVVTTELTARSSVNIFLNYCASLRVRGIISLLPFSVETLLHLKAFYPVVQCSEYNPLCPEVPYVSVDDYAASLEAVRFLCRKGCKKIGFFCASRQYRYVQNRYRAYETILQEYDLVIRPEYTVTVADFSYSRILHAAGHFFQIADPPDAIFATSDKHAHAVIKAAQTTGISVPGDVRVFGFDNSMYATLSTPAISTVEQPQREIGLKSARMLISMIRQPSVPVKSELLDTRILIREST